MSEVQKAVMNLVREQINLGSALFEAITGQPVSKLRTLIPSPRMAKGCCEIPPPCWMPQPAGECVSHVAECKSASLDVVVSNTFVQSRHVIVHVSGKGANLVQVNPPSATIPPLDRQTFMLTVHVPQGTPDGVLVDVLVVVRGCKTHYLRWKVSVGTVGFCDCNEIEIDDGPDLIHHWYDHFYCPRPCPNPAHK
jgi:hypothetical protein